VLATSPSQSGSSPREHPLWDTPGVLLTPHVAGDSVQAEQRVYGFIGEQIRRYASGEPLLNVVEVPVPTDA
jgi:phosphoglycerate dehydrogenase-like enzyme